MESELQENLKVIQERVKVILFDAGSILSKVLWKNDMATAIQVSELVEGIIREYRGLEDRVKRLIEIARMIE